MLCQVHSEEDFILADPISVLEMYTMECLYINLHAFPTLKQFKMTVYVFIKVTSDFFKPDPVSLSLTGLFCSSCYY